jgi:hypothetical protein
MKLTTSQLRKLINEEVTAAVTEAGRSGGSAKKEMLLALLELRNTYDRLDFLRKSYRLDNDRRAAGLPPYQYGGEKRSAAELTSEIWEDINHALIEISDQGDELFPDDVTDLLDDMD